MKEKPGIDRKKRIVAAAAKIFAEKGAAFVRLNEVAKVAKVPAPLIHYYFETIEDLHLDVAVGALASLQQFSIEAIQAKSSPTEAFREYVRAPFIWIDRHPDLASIVIYYYYMTTYSDRFREISTKRREVGRERIALLIYRGLESGLFKLSKGTSVKEMSYDIQSVITGHFLQFTTENRTRKLSEYAERAWWDVSCLLGAKE